ncbi:Diacylglycerol kinase family enzyme [Austwickia chelonae]|nr:diacylglycerol kinase family protein [Austwickia chelonae]SEV87169.1 Diacylglycerol kinase family enzyme [Austwickia chelonae]
MTRRAVLVTNPTSGGGRGMRYRERVNDALTANGWRVRSVCSKNADDAVRIGAEADPQECVVSLGGDGMHALVARGVARSGALLAALPGGRGNDFVRATGQPLDPVAAALALSSAGEHRVDLGEADGTPFLGVVSIGYSALASQVAAESRVRGPGVYHVAAVRAFFGVPRAEYVLSVDGVERRWSGFELAVGLSGWYGGGLQVCPEARIDDGLLDVTMVAGARRHFLPLLRRMFSGSHVELPSVETFRAEQVRVNGEGEVYADGDRLGVLPVDINVRPGALRLLV